MTRPARTSAARAFALALAVATLAPSACATLPACPARGGPAWAEWQSPHFHVLTDLDAADARAMALHFERLRAAVRLAAWRRAPEPPGPVTVIALRDERERRVFIPAGHVATFVADDTLRQAFIVVGGDTDDGLVTQTLVFALGHQYGLQGNIRWLDEGLARYFAPLRLEDDGKVTYGQVDRVLFRAATHGGLMSFGKLWQPLPLDGVGRFQVTSWLAVHYLFNHEATRFDRFQQRLIETRDAATSWREVFPDLTTEVMDARLAEYAFHEGQFAAFESRLPPVSVDTRAKPIDDAGVHALRALLHATADPAHGVHEPELRAELAEALRLDPFQTVAVFLQHAVLHERETDLETAKKVVARAPDDAMAWLILALVRQARHEDAEAKEAWEEVAARTESPGPAPEIDPQAARPD